MSGKNAIILDGAGAGAGDEELAPILRILEEELTQNGAETRTIRLRETRLAHCIGCFGCWLETPGICRENDAGREIAWSVIQSDVTVLLTPVTFGGYSSELKKAMERWVPLALPYFKKYYGEIHHLPRYSRNPRLVVIGVQKEEDPESAHLFRAIAARNALNFHAESHAAEVICSKENPEVTRWMIRSLISRNDPVMFGPKIVAFRTEPDAQLPAAAASRNALLIVGSPKTRSASTSAVLGGYLMDRLAERGWNTKIIKLKAGLQRESGQAELLSAVDRSDLMIFAFPLYVDTLPFLMTKALELIAEHRSVKGFRKPLILSAISNNGFPESYQNAPALAICRRFAMETGMAWAGGLALGAGEALSSGVSLTGPRNGRPPVSHVIEALDLSAEALNEGSAIPEKAAALMARNPIPFLPFGAWRWIYMKGGSRSWNKQAAAFGVSKEAMLARPYAD